ncbi:MAG: response regulator [Chloroflexi bacterium]|nr:response regulator [Chloroflexota bacterium]
MQHTDKILAIDDDLDLVQATRIVLESRGYRVVSAGSAEEGLKKVAEDKPDLILLDVMLPTGTQGFHFAWNLRNNPDPALRDIPIIVVSAIHSTTGLRLYPEVSDPLYQPGEFLPVQCFLDKPVPPQVLLREVEKALLARGK